jgi:hypothetical protein
LFARASQAGFSAHRLTKARGGLLHDIPEGIGEGLTESVWNSEWHKNRWLEFENGVGSGSIIRWAGRCLGPFQNRGFTPDRP